MKTFQSLRSRSTLALVALVALTSVASADEIVSRKVVRTYSGELAAKLFGQSVKDDIRKEYEDYLGQVRLVELIRVLDSRTTDESRTCSLIAQDVVSCVKASAEPECTEVSEVIRVCDDPRI